MVNPSGPPIITDFSPKTAKIGDLITVVGTNLAPSPGTAAQVTLANLGSPCARFVVSPGSSSVS